ncbi:MAG: two-component system response regulator [Acidobacteria bacterium]|nr:MAG: two-component system response regulator [Acidobacteriota bacterium]
MRRKSILLVEDNPDDEALTLRALRKHDLADEVVVVRDGAEALAFFYEATRAGDEPLPELVILDLKLPKVDGLQVLKILRDDAHTRRLPVVVLSSSSEERDIVQSYELGANSYVRKPVDFGEFSEAVRQLAIYWLGLNEPSPR